MGVDVSIVLHVDRLNFVTLFAVLGMSCYCIVSSNSRSNARTEAPVMARQKINKWSCGGHGRLKI